MSVSLRSIRYCYLFLFFIALSACNSSTNKNAREDKSLSLNAQLQKVVDEAVDSGLPGVSLHVQTSEGSISIAAGVSNIETSEPMTQSTLFHVAGIGKTHIATLIIRLVDLRVLRLEDPIALWLDSTMSSLINNSDKITVRMLLANTSGIPDYIDSDTGFLVDFFESAGKIWTPSKILDYIKDSEYDFKPGTGYKHSNTNFVLLSAMVERITGLSIATALRLLVFEPAGLVNTFGVYENTNQSILSRSYVPLSATQNFFLNENLSIIADDVDVTALLYSESFSDAFTLSTPRDLNLFIRTLIDTKKLVSGELKTEMMTESFPGESEYGLGLMVLGNGDLTYGHVGNGIGVHSAMFYTPSQDLSFATIVNGSLGSYDKLYFQYLAQLVSLLERISLG